MKKVCIISVLVMFTADATSQKYVSNLKEFSPFALDPSAAGSTDDLWISTSGRLLEVTNEIRIRDHHLSFNYPLRQKESIFGGIGLYVTRKTVPAIDVLDVTQAGLSLAYRLKITRRSFASFGIQPEFSRTKLSIDGLTTGSQWIQSELRFDPAADPGEPLAGDPVSFLSINAGLQIYRIDKQAGTKDATVGVSVFHLNRPDELSGYRKLPMVFLAHGSLAIYRSRKYKLEPGFTFQHFPGGSVIDLILTNQVYFKNEDPYDLIGSGDVQVICRVRPESELSFGLAFHQPGFAVGFAYAMPLSTQGRPVYFQSAFEASLMFTKKPRT